MKICFRKKNYFSLEEKSYRAKKVGKSCILFLLLFLFFPFFLAAEEEKKEPQNFWRNDYRNARVYAKENKKLLLLFFTVSDSIKPLNRQMIHLYKRNSSFLKNSAKDYVLVHVDLPNDPEKLSRKRTRQNNTLRNRYSVSSFPAFVLIDPQTPWGTLLYKKQGRILPSALLAELDKKFAAKRRVKKQTQQKKNIPEKKEQKKGSKT